MPFHFISKLQMSITSILNHCQIYHLSILSYNILGARPFGRPILNKYSHLVDVVCGDCLWDSQISGDAFGYAYLIQSDSRVWCYDAPRREINSFAHEIAAEAAFLPF